jgi:dTDP-4-amino-4,6-dideoxygalactose transaminase
VKRIVVADPGWVVAQHRDELLSAMERVLDSGWYILGDEVGAFEAEFASWTGTTQGVGVGSGTDAVAIALLAVGVGPGDAVFTVSHTAVATVAAIVSIGAVPVLVDIDPHSLTMSVPSLLAGIELVRGARPDLRPAAVVLVHLYGRPGPIAEVRDLCDRAGLQLIEDAAQAHGARVDGDPVGSFGDAAAFSFYPTKNLGALGDGGMVVTGRAEVAEEARLQRQYGWRHRYISERIGRNSRLDEVQAAVLRVLLPHVDSANAHRVRIAGAYDELLADGPVEPPDRPPAGVTHVYHQYVIQLDDRRGLAEHLGAAGIDTAVLYPQPVHLQAAYRDLALRVPDLSVSERVSDRVLSLPIGPHITDSNVEQVALAIRSWPTTNHR